MGDIDIGDMFLNFILHAKVQPHAGVDLTPFFPEELMGGTRITLWEHWCRCAIASRLPHIKQCRVFCTLKKLLGGTHLTHQTFFVGILCA